MDLVNQRMDLMNKRMDTYQMKNEAEFKQIHLAIKVLANKIVKSFSKIKPLNPF